MLKAAALIGFGLGSAAFSGGCSGNQEPVMTEEAKQAEQKQMEDLTKANDEASKSAASSGQQKRGMMPP